MIEFRKAKPDDALTLIYTRQKAWNATYRGIYPDEVIDEFDYEWHLKMEKKRLENPNFHCFLILDGVDCIGYFSYGTVRQGLQQDFRFRLHSFYILPAYQKTGLGRTIFQQIRQACLDAGYDSMYLDCHPDNQNALGFYPIYGRQNY